MKPKLHLKVYRGKQYHSQVSCNEEEKDMAEKLEEFKSDYFARERQSKKGGPR